MITLHFVYTPTVSILTVEEKPVLNSLKINGVKLISEIFVHINLTYFVVKLLITISLFANLSIISFLINPKTHLYWTMQKVSK